MPRLTKEERSEVFALSPVFLGECVNPAGIFGDVDPWELARKLEPAELERRVMQRCFARGMSKFQARILAVTALAQLGHL
jgi:hypothetical protein